MHIFSKTVTLRFALNMKLGSFGTVQGIQRVYRELSSWLKEMNLWFHFLYEIEGVSMDVKNYFNKKHFFQCVDNEALLCGQLTQGFSKENKNWHFYVTMPCIAEVLGAFKSVDLFLVVPDEELTLPWENLQSFGYFIPDSFLWK